MVCGHQSVGLRGRPLLLLMKRSVPFRQRPKSSIPEWNANTYFHLAFVCREFYLKGYWSRKWILVDHVGIGLARVGTVDGLKGKSVEKRIVCIEKTDWKE